MIVFAIINWLLHEYMRELGRISSVKCSVYVFAHTHAVTVLNATLSNFLPCLNN